MEDRKLKLIIGGMLHDIGKVLYRSADGRNHSLSGYEFLKEDVGNTDRDILEQIRFHHGKELRYSGLENNSLAYITYLADNIAAGADRRKLEDEAEDGFDKFAALESIFNTLNGNRENAKYLPGTLDPDSGINFPVGDDVKYDEGFYKKIRQDIKDILKNLEYTDNYVNSLLEVLEANLSFVPSSTSRRERADISLFDHMKLTACIGSCLYDYAAENQIRDYKKWVLHNVEELYVRPLFLLTSIDISGIQAFIYGQYGNRDVLKNLRARSFYLEVMLEELVDELLDRLELSRANLIYTGGGHAYLLLPDTEQAKEIVKLQEKEVNRWLLDVFQTDLYAAFGYAECSVYDLMNHENGSYCDIFRRTSVMLSEKKIHRYQAEEILALNQKSHQENERECRICHRSDLLKEDDICEICDGLRRLSREILEMDFFSVVAEQPSGIVIYPGRYLNADSEKSLRQRIGNQPGYIRSYVKNNMYTGVSVSTKLWVGDYSAAGTLEELVSGGKGIPRLGVLRADIDNLGQAFVSGFDEKYQTLSRSAAFSRKLSVFFKLHINDILRKGKYSIDGQAGERSAAIIYSGGDDLFVVGAWKDVLEFAIDLYQTFQIFSQGTLTLSAGYGLFQPKYPISYIAEQTGELEDLAKRMDGKNAIALFDEKNIYHWDTFINTVLGEKFRIIKTFFAESPERGKNFLYNLLELLRNRTEIINLARMAYVLSRMEPDEKTDDKIKEDYRVFSQTLYQWMKNEEDSRQAITAIYIYAYLIRKDGEDETDK